jgi:hypothetical protein
MSAPALVIVLGLEAGPRLLRDCMNESEELRLADWFAAHPELLDLIARARELRDEFEEVAS